MQRRLRLTGDKRFDQIHRGGRSAANQYLVIRVLPNGLDHNRFGILVGKRIGNAVTRNKVKRRLREALRQAPLEPGWDAVFIARKGVERATFQEVVRASDDLLRRARLISPNSGADLS